LYILGISAYYHDSAAALIDQGICVAAAQEERFTRIKNDSGFPHHAINYCLHEAGIKLSDLSAIVFYDKPFLKFERLLETYYHTAPRGWRSFLNAMPVWSKEKLFFKNLLKRSLKKIDSSAFNHIPLLFPEHHLSHAASTFYTSGFNQAAILTIDGVGEWTTASICMGSESGIKVLKELHFPHSIGLLYSAFTCFLGFRVNHGEYKLMGLAPYGHKAGKQVELFKSIIKDKLLTIYTDGSVFMHQAYFNYRSGNSMIPDKKWAKLFGFKQRHAHEPVEQYHANLALAIQEITEDIILKLVKTATRLSASKNLCMAGGVALNCVANGKILKSGLIDQLFIQPAAGDAGGALGAALAAYHIYFDQPRLLNKPLNQVYLGPAYDDKSILDALVYSGLSFERLAQDALYNKSAEVLANKKVLAWFQGRMEWGPRALGNRSILADARYSAMVQHINQNVKFRESFRPFAPAVLLQQASRYFDIKQASPYMNIVAGLRKDKRNILPGDFLDLSLKKRLNFDKCEISGAVHVDFSARIQTVSTRDNPRFYQLLLKFFELTQCPVLMNTSFNIKQKPIVNTPQDAIEVFKNTGIDYLVLGNYFVTKELH